jgi:hypothetical protein
MRATVPAIAVLAALAAACPAAAQTLRVGYGISLAGLPLGTADLATSLDGARYRVEVGAKLTGLIGALTGGQGTATATGSVGGAQPTPTSFALVSRSSQNERRVRIGLSRGSVSALEIVPPIDEKADRVPVTEGHKRGVIDPVSALLMPLRGKPGDPGNCNRTIPVFDGAARFDVVLSFAETRAVEKPGYKGNVLVCRARYVPIAGHRALRPATKFMQDNRDMEVWLAPLEGSRLLVPLRISVRTTIGVSVIEASQWTLQQDARIVPAASSAAKASAAP